MSKTDFEFVEISERLLPILGEPDPGTRCYRRYGDVDDYQQWWDAVCEICGEESSVSPGGVAMYARVSRAGVHKRMKEGRLTAFMFHVVRGVSKWTGREIYEGGPTPYIYIPGIECKRWAEILGNLEHRDKVREALGDGDFDGRFLQRKGRKVPKDKRKEGKR